MVNKLMLALAAFVLGMVALGIGMFNQFLILKFIGATELMWFLFWVQVPLMFIINTLAELIKGKD
jgi:hypothetical protein